MKKIIFIFSTFVLFALPSKAQYYRIQHETGTHFLNTETGNVLSSEIKEGWWSAQWEIVPASMDNPNAFRILNRWQECALDLENEDIVCKPYNKDSNSQLWSRSPKDDKGYCALFNIHNLKYLHASPIGNLSLATSSEKEGLHWLIKETESVSVVTPEETPLSSEIQNNNNQVTVADLNKGLNQAQIDAFVSSHNRIRAAVGAGNVKWNTELAAYADKWAKHLANENGCDLDHRQQNKYGENLFSGSDMSYAKPELIVAAWEEEKADYRGGVIDNDLSALHYTQVIWAKTTDIGCAIAVCPNGYIISVCNYSPAGNVYGQSPLKK